MSTEIELVRWSVSDLEVMADRVAKSKLFGLDQSQAFTLMLLADSENIPVSRAAKFIGRIEVDPLGCWLWTGPITPNGYGKFYMGGRAPSGARKPDGAHRAAYRMFVGPIPEGLVLDHLCMTRHCVNPFHLEVVTQRTNILRGNGASARVARQTVCSRGHAKTPENYYYWKGKPHGCRLCQQIIRRERTIRERRAQD